MVAKTKRVTLEGIPKRFFPTISFVQGSTVKINIPRTHQELVCSIPPYITCNTLEGLLALGISVARITADKPGKVREVLSKVRTVNESYSRRLGRINPLAIALEVKGPEIRTGQLNGSDKQIYLKKGNFTKITTNPSYEEFVCKDLIYVDYEKLPEVVQPGDKVLLDNGSVTLTAIECVESIIRCIVEKAGRLLSNASVIIPNAPIDLPLLPPSDKELLDITVGENIDYLFVSGITGKDGIFEIRDQMGQHCDCIQLVTKVECSTALGHIDELITFSDAICIDCDRLMVELPKEKVFLAQKSILAKCNLAGKPVISSINISDLRSVSKSELSDIANAIIDGSDALMIPQSACTKDIFNSICVICKEAEPAVYQRNIFEELITITPAPMEALYGVAISAVEASLRTSAAAIVCLTSSGRTAKLLAKFRPRCPIITITRYARVARQLSLYRGIEVLIYLKAFEGDWEEDVNRRVHLGITYGKYMGYIRTADAVICVTASRPECGMPNTMRIVYA
ncbi:unnamed protein product [Acanthoscelides obtectus]|uniref:Pyruvate kinase n=1 Tax=Acanthoscelides obtectus TaxID=200917 RepID=A0A9P0JU88_ACAOB|nr:unnamed protein product [Acanthoscelides obtectus]CAK1640836.1 Pyruvate kinase [Acanthoscelides obtectus]